MRFDVKFKESNQRFDVSFGEVQNVSDGGYERGYEAGYESGLKKGYADGQEEGYERGYGVGYTDGGKQTEKIVNSVLDRTITEWETDEYIYNLGTGVLRYCSKLIRIKIDSVVSIGSGALADCSLLPSVCFPNCESLTSSSFENDTNLQFADFPKLKNLGGVRAFGSCSSLNTLIIRRTDVICTLGNANAFINTPIASGTGYIYVPRNLVDSYKVATNWSTYASQIRAIEDYPEITGGVV